MKIFLTIIFLAVCIGLTVIVLMQEGKAAGLGSIGGIGDSYWGKNKGRSMEGNLVRFTKFLAAAFLILALLLNIIPDSSSSSNVQPVAAESEVTTESTAAQTEIVTESAAAQTESAADSAAVQTESAAEDAADQTEAKSAVASTESEASEK